MEGIHADVIDSPGSAVTDILILSSKTSMAIDRGTRNDEWLRGGDEICLWEDPVSRIQLRQSLDDALHERVTSLPPRAADVWRLITTSLLEEWRKTQAEPPPLWIDLRQIVRELYHDAPHRGVRPEHLVDVAKTIRALAALELLIPLGTEILPEPTSGRKRRSVKADRIQKWKILQVEAEDGWRLVDGREIPCLLRVRATGWIRLYPRQFARSFRSLIQLPADTATNVWTKSIGTELCYHCQEDRSRANVKSLKVRRLLQRCGLLNDVERMRRHRNAGRAFRYLTDALDHLQEMGVLSAWTFHAQDHERLRYGSIGWFDRWMDSRLVINMPISLVEEKPQHS